MNQDETTTHSNGLSDISDTFDKLMTIELPNNLNGNSSDQLLFKKDSWKEELLSPLSKLLRIILYSQGITKNAFIQKHKQIAVKSNLSIKATDHDRYNTLRNLNTPDITMKFFEKIVYQILGFNLENLIFNLIDEEGQRIIFSITEPYINKENKT
jgi:hypothetical protein